MKRIILDGGWYADDGKCGCDFRRDGKASKLRFPDMRAHVENVHKKLGMKVRGAVRLFQRSVRALQGKISERCENLDCVSLDPRFPGVREYLIETCGRILREWDIDGFKFDFIDMFRVTDHTGDAIAKRLGTANLRLASGTAAVHSDMRNMARGYAARPAAPQFDAKRLCASAR